MTEGGALEMDLLGEVPVAGKTPEEIDDLLTAGLKKFLKSPTVRLSIAEYHSQKVYVLGAVGKEGSYVLQGEKTLLDAILDAGGTSPGAEGRVLVFHAEPREVAANDSATGDPLTVDLTKLVAGGPAGPANMKLANGDMVLVPGVSALGTDASVVDSAEAHVTVVGEVSHPGVFRLEPGGTALSAVLAAGGLTKYAAPNRSKVVRANDKSGRSMLSLELGDIMKEGDKRKDIALEPGDMIIVPTRRF